MGGRVFTIKIAEPPEHVFDLWVDVDRMAEWTEGLTRVTDLDGGPGEVGTRWIAWFGRSKVPVEILAAVRPSSVVWRVRTAILSAEIGATFEGSPTGTLMTESIRTRGPIGAVWSRILGTGSYRGSFRGELETFARICANADGGRE